MEGEAGVLAPPPEAEHAPLPNGSAAAFDQAADQPQLHGTPAVAAAADAAAAAPPADMQQPHAVEQQLPPPPLPAADGDAAAAASLAPAGVADTTAPAAAPPAAEAPPPQPEERKRRHKWGPPAAGEFAKAEERPRKRRSRWEDSKELVVTSAKSGQIIIPGQLPKEVTIAGGLKVVLANPGTVIHADPQLQRLHERLAEFNRKLAAGELDIPPEHERSPSPEPIYDAHGVRLNTREIRARERLVERRNRLVEEVLKHDPDYKPPADYKPRKFSNKIYIPISEYPGYNFIGLIIGPRGNTQKRMQRETNCKIAIRGRGSVKEGISKDPRHDYGEEDELHVLITGESQEDVDRASAMVEKLCTPTDDEHNEHKKLQLRELAALNGTLKEITACALCGLDGHIAEFCPNRSEVYKLPEAMALKVQEQYERDVARVHGGPLVSSEAEYKAFLAELGGAPPPELMGLDTGGHKGREQLPDECKLYVGNLPPAYDSAMLRQLFEPHATVVHSAVITEQGTNASRGFGFVHIPDAAQAKATRDQLDGTVVDGRALVVRLRTERGMPGGGGPPRAGLGLHSSNSERPERVSDELKLYVAGVLPHVTDAQLREPFSRFGTVTEVRIVTDRETNQPRGFAFVAFSTREEAVAARHGMDGFFMEGKPLIVQFAGQKEPIGALGGRGGGRGGPMPPGGGPPGHFGGAPWGVPPHHGGPPGGGGGYPPWGPPPPGGPYGYGGGPPPGGPYGGPPPPWGGPPPGMYGGFPPPYGHDPSGGGGYGHDPYAAGYGHHHDPHAAAAAGGYDPWGGAPPPLPPGAPPPLPPGAPPPLPPGSAPPPSAGAGSGAPPPPWDAGAAAAAAQQQAGGYGVPPPMPPSYEQAPPPMPPAPPGEAPPPQQQPPGGGGNPQSEYERFLDEVSTKPQG